MKLTELKEKGAFVQRELVEVPVEWLRGKDEATGEPIVEAFTIHVQRMSYGDIEAIAKTMPTEDAERSYNAALISRAVVLGDDPQNAPERMDYDTAYALNPDLAYALIKAVNRVNRGKAQQEGSEKKRSSPPKKSGTSSSRKASAGRPSRKQNKT